MTPDDPFDEFSAMFADVRPQYAPAPPPVAPRRRSRRGRIVGAIIALVIVAAIATYLPLTLLAPVSSATVVMGKAAVTPPAAVALALPQVGESAISVSGADDFPGAEGTNGILAASGGTGALPIASISKLITALVVLGAKPLGATDAGPSLTFSKADSDLYDKYYVLNATVEPMKTGSIMSERDALETMLVASACNYTEAVSTWAFGSEANYLVAARKWLAANKLTGTSLVEPTGIDAHNVSTPADLITLGRLALANPVIAAIVKSEHPTVANIGTLSNTNELLGVDGVDGIKTGTLDEAGSDLLFSATVDVGAPSPISLVGVVLGGTSRDTVDSAVRGLIASIQSGFHRVKLATDGQVIGSYTTPWGDDAQVVAGDTASVLTWSNTPITSTVTTTTVKTAGTGSKVGSVVFVAGKASVTVPLVLKGSITGPDGWWRVTHPLQLLGK